MRPEFIHAREARLLQAGRFDCFLILRGSLFGILLCVLSFFSTGLLKASDPGQIAWKEHRGTMKSAEIGVVVWKEQQFHSDKTARAFAYDNMKRSGQVTWFYNGTVGKRFEPQTFVQHIRFPQWPPGEIVTQEDFDSLKFKLGELEAFAEKYPNAAGYLEGMIGSMREAVSKYSGGNVFFNGGWVTRSEHGRLVFQRNEAISKNAKEREIESRKLRAREAEQAQRDTDTKYRSLWIMIGGGVLFLFMLESLLARRWKIASAFAVALIAIAGWLTYAESGFGWAENVVNVVKDLPSLLPFTKE